MLAEETTSPSEPDIHLQVVFHRPTSTFLLRRSDRADAGFYLSVEETIALPAEKKAEIAAILSRWSRVPMRVVPTPKKDEYPEVSEHRLVGEKTYRSYVHNCSVRDLSRKSGHIEVVRYTSEPTGRGFVGAGKLELPADVSFAVALDRLWDDIIAQV